MQKIIRFVSALAVAIAFAGATHATQLVRETFTYSDGNLVGNTPEIGGAWAAHSSGGTGPVQVTSGNAIIGENSTAREDVNVPFAGGATAGAGSVLFAGFDMSIAAPTTLQAGYFAHFLKTSSGFESRLWVQAPTTSGFRLALTQASTVGTGAVLSNDLAFDTTYRIVVSYSFDNKNGALWINPTDSSNPVGTTSDTGFSDAAFGYAFRQFTPSSGGELITIDNLSAGTTFDDALTVPEPGAATLLIIGAAGLLTRRKRRRLEA